jgi:hypothetical protein
MKNSTLDCIAPLLEVLRGNGALHEVRPTVFHFNGGDFIHFHETAEGVVADVRLAKGRVRMRVSTQAERSELLERIDDALSSLESHSHGRRTGSSKGGEADG